MTQDTRGAIHTPKPIMAKLKEKSKSFHAKLGSLPYFKTLMAHRLPLESYVGQLRVLAIIHRVLENEIAAANDDRVKKVWSDDFRKLPLLQADLAFFEPRNVSDASVAVKAALSVAESIRLRSVSEAHALLGCLYVFEGTTLGNHMHYPDIVKTFHLNGMDGARYYNSYGEHVRAHWEEFTVRMNNTLIDGACHEAVIDAAQEILSKLESVYQRLYPIDEKAFSRHVTRINPEAGNHPIPEDPREIEAALEASRRVWAEFPYYQLRYGERGKRFSDSDTCWLVTLTSLDPEDLQRQINWINRVLASRGMPSIMLEQTLRILHEELVTSVPDQRVRYDKLIPAADTLSTNRRAHIPDAIIGSLCREFERAVGPDFAAKHRDAGMLLASAVADSLGGIEGALRSLRGFMEDAARFPLDWIAAVNAMIAGLEGAASLHAKGTEGKAKNP